MVPSGWMWFLGLRRDSRTVGVARTWWVRSRGMRLMRPERE